jgi:hypothetical protein
VRAKQMGQNGLRVVNEYFNWDMEEQKLFQFYKKIIKVIQS